MKLDLTQELGDLLAFAGSVVLEIRSACWTADHDSRTLQAANRMISTWSDSLKGLTALGTKIRDGESSPDQILFACDDLMRSFQHAANKVPSWPEEHPSFDYRTGIRILERIRDKCLPQPDCQAA